MNLYKSKENADSKESPEPVKYLTGKGTPQLVVENDAIQHVNGSTHGPTTVLVLAWNGSRYLDATRRFPELPRARAIEYRNRIPVDTAGRFTETLDNDDLAAGYYANALLAGDEAVARSWLIEHGGDSMSVWLNRVGPQICSLLDTTSCRIGQSRRRLLRSSPDRVPGAPCIHREGKKKAKSP